jgi:hypothetical protein
MKKYSFVLMFWALNSFGQNNCFQNAIENVLGNNLHFVYQKPIGKMELNENDIEYYCDKLKSNNILIDSVILKQIFQNSKNVDTTLWLDNEFSNYLIITDLEKKITKEYQKKFENKRCKLIDNDIKVFNSLLPSSRDIYHISRPVYDNSKKYAVVQWDNAHGGLGGGGGIIFMEYKNSSWIYLALISKWNY